GARQAWGGGGAEQDDHAEASDEVRELPHGLPVPPDFPLSHSSGYYAQAPRGRQRRGGGTSRRKGRKGQCMEGSAGPSIASGAGWVMDQLPTACLALEQIRGNQEVSVEGLVADDESIHALHEDLGPPAGDGRRLGIGEDAAPARHDLAAPDQRRPAGMDAGDG